MHYQTNNTIVGKKDIDIKIKKEMYKGMCAESWTVMTKIENRITVVEIKYLRRITNKTRMTEKEKTLGEAKTFVSKHR